MKSDEETKAIDLIKIILILWRGKITILLFSIIPLTLAFYLYSQIEQEYGYRFNFKINLLDANIKEECQARSSDCLKELSFSNLSEYLSPELFNVIEHDNFYYFRITYSDLNIDEVILELEKANYNLTAEYQRKALMDIDLMTNLSNLNYVSENELSDKFWPIYQTLKYIEENEKVFTFSYPTYYAYPISISFIIILLGVLGPIAGCFFVFFRSYLFSLKRT